VIQFEGEGERSRQIVGISEDVVNRGLTMAVAPLVYIPMEQQPDTQVSGWGSRLHSYFFVRTTTDPAVTAALVRTEVAKADPLQVITRLGMVSSWLRQSADEILPGVYIIGPLVGFALILCALGIYGVLSAAIQQRQQEFGVRIAVGASRNEIIRLVLHQGLRLTSIGLLLGSLAALALTRLLASTVVVFRSTSWVVFSVSATLVIVVSLLAACGPAWRAVALDPVVALRKE
jgi:putative ABC transport system permease protein